MATTPAAAALSANAWPIRLARVFAGSFAIVVLATYGHEVGGGHAPPVGLLALLVVIVSSLMWMLSGRRLLFGQLFGLLLLAQIGVHLAGMLTVGMVPMGLAMLIGHAIAIGLTAGVLACGERSVWALAERLGFHAVALALYRHAPPAEARPSAQRSHCVERPTRLLLVGGTGLRGPPIGPC